MGRNLENAIAILNGAVGDYLQRTHNGLAIELGLVKDGARVATDPASLARAYPAATGRLVLLVHGMMSDEGVWSFPDGSDYGSLLARDLGYTPIYLRYNSGLAIADNGAALSALLDTLVKAWPVPVEELLLIGHSLGGLVVRSACQVANEAGGPRWLPLVRKAVYVATPHLGAPLERAGRVLNRVLHRVPDPTTRLVAQIADLRSDGIKDLGDADLRHADRARRGLQLGLRDPRHPVPLLPGIEHHLVAGTLTNYAWLTTLFGDTIVPLQSATGGGRVASDALPPERVKVLPGMTHVGLAHDPAVYAQIHAWCAP